MNFVDFNTLDVGVADLENSNISVYPNPSEGKFTIDLEKIFTNNAEIVVRIFDSKGETVIVKDVVENTINID